MRGDSVTYSRTGQATGTPVHSVATGAAVSQTTSTPGQQSVADQLERERLPWLLLSLGLIYIVFMWAVQHQKIREAVKPQNIALNLWNLFVIVFSVVVGMIFLKVLFAKMAATTWPIIGTVGRYMGRLVASA